MWILRGAKFEDVTFICSNLKETKNLNTDNLEIRVLRTYRPIVLDELVNGRLLALAQNESIFAAKVIHVNKNKLNQWTLGLIHEKYGEEGIDMLSKILCKKEKWDNMYDDLSGIAFVVPPARVLGLFHESTESIYSQISENICENQELTQLRDWLLPMLMNGQATVSD